MLNNKANKAGLITVILLSMFGCEDTNSHDEIISHDESIVEQCRLIIEKAKNEKIKTSKHYNNIEYKTRILVTSAPH